MAKILIATNGTRGDMQPYIAGGMALQKAGFQVLFCGPGDAKSLADHFKVPFMRTRLSHQQILEHPQIIEAMTHNDVAKIAGIADEVNQPYREENIKNTYNAIVDFAPDLVLCSPVCLSEYLAFANALRFPVVMVALQRMRPSRYVAPLGLPDLGVVNKLAWKILIPILAAVTRKTDAPHIEKISGKDEVYPSSEQLLDHSSCDAGFCNLVAESEALCGRLPPDFNANARLIGSLMIPPEDQDGADFGTEQAAEMEAFLAKGAAPVYMGFGSMICNSSKWMLLLCLRALRISQRRGILLTAHSEMRAELLEDAPDAAELLEFCQTQVLFMKWAPHGTLFPRCSLIVHHGGCGTMASAARAGKPMIVCPVAMDQFLYAELVNARGLGKGFAALKLLEPEALSSAMEECLKSTSIQSTAREVAEGMKNEDAAGKLVDFVKEYMEDFVKTGRHLKIQDELARQRASRGFLAQLMPCLPCGPRALPSF
ncbi:unnamed protein product [Effrenium voratum]|nr:unnamed protein product [Effrenium voratum]